MRRLIGIAEVCRLTARSPSTVRRYLNCSALDFPSPVRLGPRDRGWFADEILAWIEARPRNTGGGNDPTLSDRRSDADHAPDTGP